MRTLTAGIPFLFVAFGLVSLPAFSAPRERPLFSSVPIDPAKATIYVYRMDRGRLQSWWAPMISLDGKPLVEELPKGGYLHAQVTPGTHVVGMRHDPGASFWPADLLVETVAGREYFISAYDLSEVGPIIPGVLISGTYTSSLTDVGAEVGGREIRDMRLAELLPQFSEKRIEAYPFVASAERAAAIEANYRKARKGMTVSEIEAVLGAPDEVRRLYDPKVKKDGLVGYTYWYVLRRARERGSVKEMDEQAVRVAFNIKGYATKVSRWGR